MKKIILLLISTTFLLSNCKDEEKVPVVDENALTTETLSDLAVNVIIPTYDEMQLSAKKLEDDITAFKLDKSEENLLKCKNQWLHIRQAWEQSEGFLFGPVATENIDPRIDTWPVNFKTLDSVMLKHSDYDNTLIHSFEDALKGFHPIEYLLFGQNGDKKATDFKTIEFNYLLALSHNLTELSKQVYHEWTAATPSFKTTFTQINADNAVYTTKLQVYEELVNALIGICDEVANGKIEEPLITQEPSLEESPFSGNSFTDFANNMRGVKNIYLGKYNTMDGKGIEDFVRLHNLSLDASIKLKLDNAINALTAFKIPFGRAIIEQPLQVTNAQTAINELKDELELKLLPLIQLKIK